MKIKIFIFILMAMYCPLAQAQVPAISSTTKWGVVDGNNAFVMDIADIEDFFLHGVNKMNTTSRNALTPSDGWVIYNTETKGSDTYNGTRWFRTFQSAGTPTFTRGSGYGTGSSSSIEGTDLAGKITISTGSGSLTMTKLGDITFNKALATGAKYAVFFSNANTATADLNTHYLFTASRTVSGYTIDFDNSSMSGRIQNSSTYEFFYHVIQYE